MVKKKGILDLTARIGGHLLANSKIKGIIKILENNIDSENAEELAKVIVRSDIEFFISIIGIVPKIVNTEIIFINTIVKELKRLPPELIDNFFAILTENIDNELFKKSLKNINKLIPQEIKVSIIESLSDFMVLILDEIIKEYGKKKSPVYIATDKVILAVEKGLRKKPALKKRLIKITELKNEKK